MSSSHPSTLREAFRQHLVVTQRKPRTIEAYLDAVVQFHRFRGGASLLQVTVNDVRAYLFHLLHERRCAPRTYNQHLYGLKAFYETFMPQAPMMATFGRHSTPDKAIAVVSRFDFDRMVKRTDNLKHRAVLTLLYSAGLRCSECYSWDVDHWNASYDNDTPDACWHRWCFEINPGRLVRNTVSESDC